MKQFIALYLAPVKVIEEWMATPAEKRKAAEDKMRGDWQQWMAAHSKLIVDTQAGGKTKKVSAQGTTDIKNEIMMYSIVQAETHEAATKIFEKHPHLTIPQSTIEVMEIRGMGSLS